MANTYSSLFYHLVFSTKNRKSFLNTEIQNRIWSYIGGIARAHQTTAIQVGGIEDHAHVLILAKPIHAPSQIVQNLKGESSKWIHTEFENLKQFAWQDGFGVFSVSKSKVSDVVDYIKNQSKHHQRESFEEEYDMKYLLD